MNLKLEFLKKAKNKTQRELIDHLFETNGSMIVKHGMKIDKAMDLVNDYPDDFEWSYLTMYPMSIDFRIKSLNFINK